jgi:polar amino acid transport system substrate-binding protein
MKLSRLHRQLLLALVLATGAAGASAGCSRPLVVPASPLGLSVTVKGDQVGGAFPEVLDEAVARAGCKLVYSVVPRARLELMFETGKADLLMTSTKTARRDKFGIFVPLIVSRATLVSIDAKRAPIHNMQELLARRELRVALVRGFDYGPAYHALAAKLSEQGRVAWAKEPVEVARMLMAGMADMTIMPPSALVGAASLDERISSIRDKVRVEPLDELMWARSGMYISRTLPAADRAVLEKVLNEAGREGALYKALQRLYPQAVLSQATKPL